MKHFAQGLEWTWTKEKFMARKADMNEFYLDFKEDNKIDLEKFQASVITQPTKPQKSIKNA